jgi:4-oxalocrotonate tautomerase
MPLINVRVLENVFTLEQKKTIIRDLTDAMVAIEGEAFRTVTWVTVEEVKEGCWGIGGHPLHKTDVENMRTAYRKPGT